MKGAVSAIESWMRRCVGNRRGCRYQKNGGWFYNWMFERELPYVWRNNSRCADGRFWDLLAEMMSVTDLGAFPLLVFHDGLGGWRGRPKCGRYLRFGQAAEAIAFLRRYARYGQRYAGCGRRNDNYNLLSEGLPVGMTLSHEGETLVFAKDAELLRPYVRFFKRKHLVVHL